MKQTTKEQIKQIQDQIKKGWNDKSNSLNYEFIIDNYKKNRVHNELESRIDNHITTQGWK
tara:strand:- start:488 stop:667 length:180 start_codon:yes stop_codon:yes gene_type:complete